MGFSKRFFSRFSKGFFNWFFFLTLVARACIHGYVAVHAAKDLNRFHSVTKHVVAQIAIHVSGTSDIENAVGFPFVFYVICAVTLFVLVCLHPWESSTQAQVIIYAVAHSLYVVFEVYGVYIHGLMDISIFRGVYSAMYNPFLFLVSLALDVLTITTACSDGLCKKPTDSEVVLLLPDSLEKGSWGSVAAFRSGDAGSSLQCRIVEMPLQRL